MIFWRGYGILVIILTALSYTATSIGAEMIWGDPLPAEYAAEARLFGMLLSALLVLLLHVVIGRSSKSRVLIDKGVNNEPGNMIIMKTQHDFLFIPLKFWPYILAAIGLVLYFGPWG